LEQFTPEAELPPEELVPYRVHNLDGVVIAFKISDTGQISEAGGVKATYIPKDVIMETNSIIPIMEALENHNLLEAVRDPLGIREAYERGDIALGDGFKIPYRVAREMWDIFIKEGEHQSTLLKESSIFRILEEERKRLPETEAPDIYFTLQGFTKQGNPEGILWLPALKGEKLISKEVVLYATDLRMITNIGKLDPDFRSEILAKNKLSEIGENPEKKYNWLAPILGIGAVGAITAALLPGILLANERENFTEEEYQKIAKGDPEIWKKLWLNFLKPADGGEFAVKLALSLALFGVIPRFFRKSLYGEELFDVGAVGKARLEPPQITLTRQLKRLEDFTAKYRISQIDAEGNVPDNHPFAHLSPQTRLGIVRGIEELRKSFTEIPFDIMASGELYHNLVKELGKDIKDAIHNISPPLEALTTALDSWQRFNQAVGDAGERIQVLEARKATGEITPQELEEYERCNYLLKNEKRIKARFQELVDKDPKIQALNFAYYVEMLRQLEEGVYFWDNKIAEIEGAITDAMVNSPGGRIPQNLEQQLAEARQNKANYIQRVAEAKAECTAKFGTPPSASLDEIAATLIREYHLESTIEAMRNLIDKWTEIAEGHGIPMHETYESYVPMITNIKLAPREFLEGIIEKRIKRPDRSEIQERFSAFYPLGEPFVREAQIPVYAVLSSWQWLTTDWLPRIAFSASYTPLIGKLKRITTIAENLGKVFKQAELPLDTKSFTDYLVKQAETIRGEPNILARKANEWIDEFYRRLQKSSGKTALADIILRRRANFEKDAIRAMNNIAVNSVLFTYRTFMANLLGLISLGSLRVSIPDLIREGSWNLYRKKISNAEIEVAWRGLIEGNENAVLGDYWNGGVLTPTVLPKIPIDELLGSLGLAKSQRGYLWNKFINMGGTLYWWGEKIGRNMIAQGLMNKAMRLLEKGEEWDVVKKELNLDRFVEGTEERYKYWYDQIQGIHDPNLRKLKISQFANALGLDAIYQTQSLHPRGGNIALLANSGSLFGSFMTFWQFPMHYVGLMLDVLSNRSPTAAAKMFANYFVATFLLCKAYQTISGVDMTRQLLGGEWWLPFSYIIKPDLLPSLGVFKIGGPLWSPMTDLLMFGMLTQQGAEGYARGMTSWAFYNLLTLDDVAQALGFGEWKLATKFSKKFPVPGGEMSASGVEVIYEKIDPITGKQERYVLPLGIPSQWLPYGQEIVAITKTLALWNMVNKQIANGQVSPEFAIPIGQLVARSGAFGGMSVMGSMPLTPFREYFGIPGVSYSQRYRILQELDALISSDPYKRKENIGDVQQLIGYLYEYMPDIAPEVMTQIAQQATRDPDMAMALAQILVANSPLGKERQTIPKIIGGGEYIFTPLVPPEPVPRDAAINAFKILFKWQLYREGLTATGEIPDQKELSEINNAIDMMFASDTNMVWLRNKLDEFRKDYTTPWTKLQRSVMAYYITKEAKQSQTLPQVKTGYVPSKYSPKQRR